MGRLFFLTPRPIRTFEEDGGVEYPLAKITLFTEHKDVIRRGGVAATIKFVPTCFRELPVLTCN
jgi:Domain of unknown function (DUF383)